MTSKINKRWFKNRLEKGLFECRREFYYTDDYAYDKAMNFGRELDFKPAKREFFTDWYINASSITGEKDGIIDVYFAECELYKFKLITNQQ